MNRSRILLECVLAAVLGFGACTLAGFLRRPPGGSLLPVYIAVEYGNEISPLVLFLVGSGLGLRTVSAPWLVGISTIALFPLIAIVEFTVIDPTSHNLWPFEFLVHGLFGAIAIGGVYVGRRMAKKFGQ